MDPDKKACPFHRLRRQNVLSSKKQRKSHDLRKDASTRRMEQLLSHINNKPNAPGTSVAHITTPTRLLADLPGPGEEDTDAYYSQNHSYIHSLHETYGDEVVVSRKGQSVLFFRNPECVKSILTSASNFGKVWQTEGDSNTSETTDYVHNLLQPMRANSVFNMHGEENAKRRRGFRTVFLGSDSFAKSFRQEIDHGLLQWEQEGLGDVNIFQKTHNLIRNAIFVILCGDESPQVRDLVKDIFNESVNYFVERYKTPPCANSPPIVSKEDELLSNRTEIEAKKVVESFKAIVATSYPDGKNMPPATRTCLLMKMVSENYSDEEMAAMLVNVLIAAEEAVTSTLAQILQEFAYNPSVRNAALREAINQEQEILSGETGDLDYITNCALEGLRLFAPATLVKRQARKDTIVNNILIPKGTIVELCISSIHQNESMFPNSKQFDPLRSGLDHYMLGNEQLFMSFSGGERGCPGRHLALTILQLSISRILTRFDLKPSPSKPRWVNDSVPKFVVWPLDGIFLDLHRRE